MTRTYLDYDDVLLVPTYSILDTRKDVVLHTRITRNVELRLPLVSAPMDTVTEWEMAEALALRGGMGFIHRYNTPLEQAKHVRRVTCQDLQVGAAVGVVGDYQERAQLLAGANVTVFLVDVAHGDHKLVMDAIQWLKKNYPHIDVLAGNVATPIGAKHLIAAGADGLRVGIGSGAHCTTRIETGVGVPQLSAVQDCVAVSTVPVCADGGIRFAGDAVKALAAGASTVMCGNVLAGTTEAPGHVHVSGYGTIEQKFKEYRGMASHNAKIADRRDPEHVEGISKMIPFKGPVDIIIKNFEDGIRSGCSYLGAQDLANLRKHAQFIEVTPSVGHISKVHL